MRRSLALPRVLTVLLLAVCLTAVGHAQATTFSADDLQRGETVRLTLSRPGGKVVSGNIVALGTTSLTLEHQAMFGRYARQEIAYADIASARVKAALPTRLPHDQERSYKAPLIMLGVVAIAAFVTFIVILSHTKGI